MVDRPILFSGPMVRALLDDRKTQTRRTLKFQPAPGISIVRKTIRPLDAEPYHAFERRSLYGNYAGELDIRIKRGDQLWVRESWWIATMYSYGTTPGGCEIDPPPLAYRRRDPVHYAADGNPVNVGNRTYGPDGLRSGSFAAPDPYAIWLKKPSIHMPRWASRLTLTVTDVRVEKLQGITEADAIAEGCFKGKASGRVFNSAGAMHLGGDEWANARDWYADLWESINGAGSWDANPWVAAYTFTVERRNIDAPDIGIPRSDATSTSGGE